MGPYHSHVTVVSLVGDEVLWQNDRVPRRGTIQQVKEAGYAYGGASDCYTIKLHRIKLCMIYPFIITSAKVIKEMVYFQVKPV